MKQDSDKSVKLFHASETKIPFPDLKRGRKNADFGQGFYLSPDYDFVTKWAVANAYINEYELNLGGLKIVEFNRSKDWLHYILNNRKLKDGLDADVIVGPISNDTIFDTFGIIGSGYLSDDELLSLLMVGPEYTQLVIKTEKARNNLTFVEAKVFKDYEKTRSELKIEEEEYQKEFAEKMTQIVDTDD